MPKNSSEARITSLTMYSIAVGITFDLIIWGTVSIAISRFGNGISKLIAFFGSGRSLNIALVTIPRVPSEPTIKSLRLYPELFFTTLPPISITSPLGSTTSSPLTKSLVTPYLTALIPPAFVFIFPPIVALFSPGSGG